MSSSFVGIAHADTASPAASHNSRELEAGLSTIRALKIENGELETVKFADVDFSEPIRTLAGRP